MSAHSSIALIEFTSIAAGTFAADAMAKKALLESMRTGTVQPGKFLVLIAGETAEVELAYGAGILAGASAILDDVFLPDADAQVRAALAGKRRDDAYDTLGVLETTTVAAIVRAADAAMKGAEVNLMEMRLADGLGGKGVAYLTGDRSDVEAAVEIASMALAGREGQLCHSITSRVDERVSASLGEASYFSG